MQGGALGRPYAPNDRTVKSWGERPVGAGRFPSTLSPLANHTDAPELGKGWRSPVPASGGRQAQGSRLHVGAGPDALVVGEPDLRGAGLWQMIDTKLGEVSC